MTTVSLPNELTQRIDTVCAKAPVIPVLTIHNLEDALPLAEALVSGGLPVLEVTLRTDAGLKAIETIARELPEACVGAGTIINPDQFQQAVNVGSQFIVSPGSTAALLDHACQAEVPLLPGIQTVSEMMEGIQRGFKRFKFFPAEASGGTPILASLAGPFADIRFCPTGGIKQHTASNYLSLPNVMCVGGTWLTPQSLVDTKDWAAISEIAKQTIETVSG